MREHSELDIISDLNLFCDPQHFGGNFTVWTTYKTVFYPNFFCDPKHFGEFFVAQCGNIYYNRL